MKLFIIADDFTGALDTGVQFAALGIDTLVTLFEPNKTYHQSHQACVVNAETRHLPPEDAFARVEALARQAKADGFSIVFKKCDSALRGNIGAELAALVQAQPQSRVHFIPAFPSMNRTTKDGIHYIDGVPVAESIFGKDPFEPVTKSSLVDIIGQQTALSVTICGKDVPTTETDGICVYDAQVQEDIAAIVSTLTSQNELALIAGCAGLGAELAAILTPQRQVEHHFPATQKLLIACGSMHRVSKAQCRYGAGEGIPCFSLQTTGETVESWCAQSKAAALASQLQQTLEDSPVAIVDVQNDSASREEIGDAAWEQDRSNTPLILGRLLKNLLDGNNAPLLMVMGGDCLLGLMQQLQVTDLKPCYELMPGVVLSEFTYATHEHYIISKSGAFGGEMLFCEIARMLHQ